MRPRCKRYNLFSGPAQFPLCPSHQTRLTRRAKLRDDTPHFQPFPPSRCTQLGHARRRKTHPSRFIQGEFGPFVRAIERFPRGQPLSQARLVSVSRALWWLSVPEPPQQLKRGNSRRNAIALNGHADSSGATDYRISTNTRILCPQVDILIPHLSTLRFPPPASNLQSRIR